MGRGYALMAATDESGASYYHDSRDYRSQGLDPTAADIKRSHNNYCAKAGRIVAVSLLGVLLAWFVFRFAVIPYEELLEDKTIVDRQRDTLQRTVEELEQKLSNKESSELCHGTEIDVAEQNASINMANLLQDNERCVSSLKYLEREVESEKSLLSTCQADLTDSRKMVILCESKVAEREKENDRANRLHQKCLDDVAEGKNRVEECGREREDCAVKSLELNNKKIQCLVELEKCKTSVDSCISKVENMERNN